MLTNAYISELKKKKQNFGGGILGSRKYIRLSIDAHAAVRPDSDQTIGACLSTTGYRLTRACTATWHVKRVNNCEKDGDR